jgi:hypothetical protein
MDRWVRGILERFESRADEIESLEVGDALSGRMTERLTGCVVGHKRLELVDSRPRGGRGGARGFSVALGVRLLGQRGLCSPQ